MSDTSTTLPITNTSAIPFDYTSRDFTAVMHDITRRMQRAIPGWEPAPTAFEMIILEQFAYIADILNFYIDRMAAESYIQTAVMRESVLNLAYAFGYVPTPQTSATASVTFTKNTVDDVVVPKGTKVYANAAGSQVIFETSADGTITGVAASTLAITAREGVTITLEPLGVSSGAERMSFPLLQKNVIKDSVTFYVRDGGIDASTQLPALVPWSQVYRMIDADATDRVFTVYVNEIGTSIIRLGDGVTGRIPTTGAAVFATYRYGKGATGNVPINTIRSLVSGGDLAGKITSLTNLTAATGGANAESLQSMRTNIPRSLRALDRAVTLQDYVDLVIQVPGVSKSGAGAVLSTGVSLAVLGPNYTTPDTTLVQNFINARKMIGTSVTIIGPTYKLINVTGTVTVNALYVRSVVDGQVDSALGDYFSFDNVDFGFAARLSDIFRVIMSVDGVDNCTVSALYIQGDTAALNQVITLAYNEFPKVGTLSITASGGIVPT